MKSKSIVHVSSGLKQYRNGVLREGRKVSLEKR